MYCTTVYISHGPWIVQWYINPMAHGLYNVLGGIYAPWAMGCIRVYISMAHGLYNALVVYVFHDPWAVQ